MGGAAGLPIIGLGRRDEMRELEEIWAEAFRERYNEGPKRVTMLFGEKVREECEREVEERYRGIVAKIGQV